MNKEKKVQWVALEYTNLSINVCYKKEDNAKIKISFWPYISCFLSLYFVEFMMPGCYKTWKTFICTKKLYHVIKRSNSFVCKLWSNIILLDMNQIEINV